MTQVQSALQKQRFDTCPRALSHGKTSAGCSFVYLLTIPKDKTAIIAYGSYVSRSYGALDFPRKPVRSNGAMSFGSPSTENRLLLGKMIVFLAVSHAVRGRRSNSRYFQRTLSTTEHHKLQRDQCHLEIRHPERKDKVGNTDHGCPPMGHLRPIQEHHNLACAYEGRV